MSNIILVTKETVDKQMFSVRLDKNFELNSKVSIYVG